MKIRFEEQAVTEDNKKPDFLFPMQSAITACSSLLTI